MFISSFDTLEENVVVFSTTTGNWVRVWVQSIFTEFSQSFLIDQVFEYFSIHYFNFLNFMRCTESIKEVQEWYRTFDC